MPFFNGSNNSAVPKTGLQESELLKQDKTAAALSPFTSKVKNRHRFFASQENQNVHQHPASCPCLARCAKFVRVGSVVRPIPQAPNHQLPSNSLSVPCRQIQKQAQPYKNLFRNNRSQVTIFIFLGALVVLLVGFFSIAAIPGTSPSSSPAKSAKQFVELCFNEASECTLYAKGNIGEEIIPDLVHIQEESQSAVAERAKTCLASNHFSQDVAVTSITPTITFNEKTRITTSNDIVGREENEEITIDNYKETFDVPFKALYAEAVQLKSGAKPAGVPESFIKLDNAFDVDVAEQDGKKIISLAAGELKKQYYRFTLIK